MYDVPSTRRITWNAGLDPIGGIPNYTSVTLGGLDPTGITDNTSLIQAGIDGAAANTAVFIPVGIYKVSSDLNMKSNVVLRGAKIAASLPFLPSLDATVTTLNMTAGSRIVFPGGSKGANWNPGAGSGTAITAGYTKDSTSLTLSDASIYSVNDWISIYQDTDSTDISVGGATWLGEDISSGDQHVFQQYSKITAKSGNVLTIDPGIYLTSTSPTGQSVRKQTFGVVMAGVENLRLNGSATQSRGIVNIVFSKNIWVKGVETYNTGANSGGSPHVWIQFSAQCEIRDSYFHYGPLDGGMNYGVEIFNWNSAHKIENNIFRDLRHSIVFEGGSGSVSLYNYTDDNGEGTGYVIDNNFLSEDQVVSHGAHPHMNLFEGNYSSNIWGDNTWGSSGYNTLFRNCITGFRTNHPLISPFSWDCIRADNYNRNFNFVGNVVGFAAMGGTVLCNTSTYCSVPNVYVFGRAGNPGSYVDTLPASTAIKHGNYDYNTVGVAHWDGGADHTLRDSMYYNSKPSFFGTCAWPPFGPESNPTVLTLPAKDRYDGTGLCPPDTGPPPLSIRGRPSIAVISVVLAILSAALFLMGV